MERRSFLDSLGTALGLSLAGLLGTRRTGLSLGSVEENDPTLEGVRTAMLTMQRQAWEKGVATKDQAFSLLIKAARWDWLR